MEALLTLVHYVTVWYGVPVYGVWFTVMLILICVGLLQSGFLFCRRAVR